MHIYYLIIKRNTLVEKMKKAEDSISKDYPETLIPFSVIEYLLIAL